jgi:magnesium-transporting ATPase (P-type)
MSIIIENEKEECFVFCKGSPKLIAGRSIIETLPPDYQDQVNNICKNGLRMISFGFKQIDKNFVKKIHRSQVENDLVFLGFYVMENQLKDGTKKTIKALRECNIKNTMISGDNIYTCIAVSIESGIIMKQNEVFIGEIIYTGEGDGAGIMNMHMSSQIGKNDSHMISSYNRQTFGKGDSVFKNKEKTEKNLYSDNSNSGFLNVQKQRKESDFSKMSEVSTYAFGQKFEFDHIDKYHKGAFIGTQIPKKIEQYIDKMTNNFEIRFVSIGSKKNNIGTNIKFKEGGKFHKIWTFKDIYEKKDSNLVLGMTSESFIVLLCKIIRNEKDYNLKKNMMQYLAHSCRTFGEVNYEMKKEIIKFIKTYKNSKYLTGYVGDGTNDCEALREADVSMALGEFDISIAAPFVSKEKNISSILTLIKEGKANLTNGFYNFRFFIFFTTCQFCGLLLLFFFYISWNASQLIWMDLVILTVFGYLISSFRPGKLTSEIPKSSLFNKRLMISLFLQILFSLIILITSYYILRNHGYSFYKRPIDIIDEHAKESGHINIEQEFYDNHFLFIVINNFFVIYFFTINFRGRFREKLFKKPLTICYLFFMFAMNIIWLNLANNYNGFEIFITTFLKKTFHIPEMPGIWKCFLIILVFNMFAIVLIELLVDYYDRKYQKRKNNERIEKCKIFRFLTLRK